LLVVPSTAEVPPVDVDPPAVGELPPLDGMVLVKALVAPPVVAPPTEAVVVVPELERFCDPPVPEAFPPMDRPVAPPDDAAPPKDLGFVSRWVPPPT